MKSKAIELLKLIIAGMVFVRICGVSDASIKRKRLMWELKGAWHCL